MKKLLVLLIALVGLAGCMTPQGQSTPPPIAKTATESPLISSACRSELVPLQGGSDLANSADVDLGYWLTQGSPADEVANTLGAFSYAAQRLGAVDCG